MTRPTPRALLRFAAGASGLAAAFALLAGVASAATYTVNTTADQAPALAECSGAAGDCSLRQAVDKANTAAGADTIVVPAGTYALTIKGSGETESGDLDVTEGGLRVEGAGARTTVVDASALEDRIFDVHAHAALTLAGLTVTGGSPEGPLERSESEGYGGGIRVEEGTLDLQGVAVTDNEASNAARGGGIAAEGAEVSITASTISGNRNSGDGGGIHSQASKLRIENSTIADNLVDTGLYPSEPSWGAYGGAMEVGGGSLEMKNVTISGNSIVDSNGEEHGKGAALAIGSETTPIEIVNTIVYGSTASKVEAYGQCQETVPSLGHNLEGEEPSGEPRCFEQPSDLIANPLLGALANNGGETDTMALSSGSSAIDAGDPSNCPATDQRGVARPQGGGCDIGAYEFTPAPTATATPAAARFSIKKVKYLPRKGTAKLKLAFTGPGRIVLSGKGVRKVSRRVKAGTRFIPVDPKRSLRGVLRKRGRAKVKVKLRFTPDTGAVQKKARKLRLRLVR